MKSNFITAAHVPGIMNVKADVEARSPETKAAGKLNEFYFHSSFNDLIISSSVNVFASWINAKIPRFFSYRQDLNAKVINAFTVNRHIIDFYCFLPCSCIGKVIVSNWPSIIEKHQWSISTDWIIRRSNSYPNEMMELWYISAIFATYPALVWFFH